MIAYLSANNLHKAAAALRAEAKLGNAFDDATSKKYEGLLEKKWTSVVRLQKKVGRPLPNGRGAVSADGQERWVWRVQAVGHRSNNDAPR